MSCKGVLSEQRVNMRHWEGLWGSGYHHDQTSNRMIGRIVNEIRCDHDHQHTRTCDLEHSLSLIWPHFHSLGAAGSHLITVLWAVRGDDMMKRCCSGASQGSHTTHNRTSDHWPLNKDLHLSTEISPTCSSVSDSIIKLNINSSKQILHLNLNRVRIDRCYSSECTVATA